LVYQSPGNVELTEVPEPVAGPGEVVVAVQAAGVCQTDVHIWRGEDSRVQGGTVLGHEVAGKVASLGSAVTEWEIGQSIAVYPVWSCGACAACASGRRNACRRTGDRRTTPKVPGIAADGGMAELVVVPADSLVDIGDLDPGVAATLADAGLAPYSSVKEVAPDLGPKSTAVVIGLGGLGNMALQALRAMSACQVVAIDVDPAARARAEPWADHLLAGGQPDVTERILTLTGGYGAEAVLDFVGSDETVGLAADVVAPFGAIRISGLGGGQLAVRADAGCRLPAGASVVPRAYSGSYPELLEVLALAGRGLLQPAVERFPLGDGARVLEILANGQVGGRAVLEP
jgi:propanol-preferring alcohol dehydrogenase